MQDFFVVVKGREINIELGRTKSLFPREGLVT